MRIVNGIVGGLLILLAALHVFTADASLWVVVYLSGAALAFTAMRKNLRVPTSRILAVATTGAMFYFFAGFFMICPQLPDQWYLGPQNLHAMDLLIAAFAMIPVLAEYSCRLKSTFAENTSPQRACFFSVPQKLEHL